MKKLVSSLLVVLLCFFMVGCSNEFAKLEYDSELVIAEMWDNYAKEVSSSFTENGEYTLTISKFDGRETIWTGTSLQDQDIELPLFLSLSKGQAKIVHIDEDGNVTTLIECTPDTSTAEYVTKTVSLKSGQNRLKIIGYDCETIDFKMMVPEL